MGVLDAFCTSGGEGRESVTQRPVLQWLHAMYAVGGITGAAIAGLVSATDTDYRIGLLFGAIVLFLAAFWNAQAGSSERGATEVDSSISLSAVRRHPALWLPALVVLSEFLVEGSMDTWSGLYLKRQLGASDWQTAMAVVAFSAGAAVGRQCGGRLCARRRSRGAGCSPAASCSAWGGALRSSSREPVGSSAGRSQRWR